MTHQSNTLSSGSPYRDSDRQSVRPRVGFIGVRLMQLCMVLFCLFFWVGVFGVAVNAVKTVSAGGQIARVHHAVSLVVQG
jgi:hypothetical protein